jgi:hypothetical protein
MDKANRVSELLAITSRLIDCMEREVELLHNLQPAGLKQLQTHKVMLADSYKAFALALKEPGEDLAEVDPALRDELMEATERFHAAVLDNLRSLRAMRDVNERVMRAVVKTLDEDRGAVTGYSNRGTITKLRRAAGAGPVAVQQRI